MWCRRLIPLVALSILATVLAPLAAWGQVSPQGLLSEEGARRAGLSRMWFTQLEMDSSRGRMQGITQHVSSSLAHTVFEVTFRGRSYVFSELELDAFGEPIGVEGAKAAAEKKVAQLTLLLTPPPGVLPAKETAPPASEAPVAPPAGEAPTAVPEVAAAPLPAPKGAPVMTLHVIPEITLYATSERGMVHAIDAETGKTKWATSVGDPRFPTSNSGASDDVVAVFNGSKVYVLKASDGTISWEKSIRGAPIYGPAVSEDFVFIPLLNGMVEAYWINYPKRAAATFRSMGHPTTQPVVLNRSVAWATDRGHVYVASATDAKIKFRVETKDNVVSTPGFLGPDRILASSLDGYVYCMREARGGISWRFSTGEAMTHGPIGVRDTVYAIADSGTIYAIDVDTGAERWTSSGIRGFIAATSDRLYCSDINGSLVVIDSRSGSRVASMSAPELEVRLVNTETDRIIVGTPSGMLQCFRELDRKWPEVRLMIDESMPRKPGQKPADKKDEAKPMVPAAEEKTAEDDPFAKPAPGAAKTPPAETAPPAEGTDPFGEKK